MALPESAFQRPYWIRIDYGATLSRNDTRRFDNMEMRYNRQPDRAWRIRPYAGHNAQNPVITPDRPNLATDAAPSRSHS